MPLVPLLQLPYACLFILAHNNEMAIYIAVKTFQFLASIEPEIYFTLKLIIWALNWNGSFCPVWNTHFSIVEWKVKCFWIKSRNTLNVCSFWEGNEIDQILLNQPNEGTERNGTKEQCWTTRSDRIEWTMKSSIVFAMLRRPSTIFAFRNIADESKESKPTPLHLPLNQLQITLAVY